MVKWVQKYGFNEYIAFYLVSNYGKQSDTILSFFDGFNDKDIHQRFVKAECEFCIQQEMVFNLRDFFIRRTGRLYFDIDSVRTFKEVIADHMKAKFKWSEKRKEEELNLLDQEIWDVSTFKDV